MSVADYSAEIDSFNTKLKAYIDSKTTPVAANVSTLAADTVAASGTYADTELQATMDKVDDVIAALIAAGLMSAP